MAKRSIYFPDDLERRMAEFADENWSGVCQEAVVARIQTLNLRSKTMLSATERASARLAASKARYIEQAGERGRKVGADWAADRAEYAELKRLAAAAEDMTWEDEEAATELVRAIFGGHADRSDYSDFYDSIGLERDDPDATSSDFWYGFVQAAIEVFDNAGV